MTIDDDNAEARPTASNSRQGRVGTFTNATSVLVNFLDPCLPDRFWSKVQPCPMTGCWLFVGCQLPCAYGMIVWRGQQVLAHRLAYEQLVGQIPDGLHIDHLCRVRPCVNPAHLEPVTQRENVLRGDSPVARLARQTHCKNGHELTDSNVYLTTLGGRRCRACDRQRGPARSEARRRRHGWKRRAS